MHRVLRFWNVAGLMVVGLVVAGCEDANMFAEPDPRGGVALVGEQYVAYFPVCGREAIGYRVIEPGSDGPMSLDEMASQNAAEDEDVAEAEAEIYWEVDDPAVASAKEGWVTLGDDGQFGEVTTSVADDFVWPESFVVQAFLDTFPDKDFSYGAVVYDIASVPQYEDGVDLEEIGYLSGTDLLTPEELRARSGLCSS